MSKGKHIDCEATDEWKTNESAKVGASLEEPEHSHSPLTFTRIGLAGIAKAPFRVFLFANRK